MASTELKAIITAEDKATPTLKKLGASLSSVAGGVALGTLAVQGLEQGFGFLVDQVKTSIRAFSEAQDVQAKLNAVITSTGGAAGITATSALALSKSLESVTTFSDEAVLSAEDTLLTFTKIGKEAFPQVVEGALNISKLFGGDLQGAAIQLGKALQDPTQGLTALRRSGVSFTEAQVEMINTLYQSGDALGAQKIILQEVDKEFGGQARAAALTYSGTIQQLSNSINDLQEKIGGAIVKGITPFAQKLAAFVNSPEGQHFADQLTDSITKFFTFITNHQAEIINFFTGLWGAIKAVGSVIVTIVNGFNDLTTALGKAISLFEIFAQRTQSYGIGAAIKGLFSTGAGGLAGKATGGSVNSNQPYVVGERGPELFVPHSGGTIVPNNQMGGSSITIQFNGGVSMQSNADIDEIGRRLADQIRLVNQGAL